MPLTRRRVTDSDALKALAHPVRLALLETLVTEGPMTATQAAGRVGSSPSNCSWHLRKLAEHGFVREARGHTGRNRPWQAVSQGLDWGEPDDAGLGRADGPDRCRGAHRPARRARGPAAAGGAGVPGHRAGRLAGGHRARVVDAVADRRGGRGRYAGSWPTCCRRRSELSAERAAHPETRPEDARLVSLVGWLVPAGPQRDPEPGARP